MSFRVDFWQMSKRPNSTKRPDLQHPNAGFDCTLKGPCSIMAPVLEVEYGYSQNNPIGNNYCYIAMFDRFYWVTDWTNDGPLWICTLQEDELATWRTAIGSSTQYILRSSHSSDGYIVDELYPMFGSTTMIKNQGSRYPYSQIGPAANEYCYIIGIVNNDNGYAPARIGAVCYYAVTPTCMQDIMGKLMAVNTLTGFDAANDNISDAVFKSMIDPIQYVVSCMFMPIPPSTGGAVTDMGYGPYALTGLSGCQYVNLNALPATVGTVAVPKHPQASTRGGYLNMAPYAQYAIDFRPFGFIPLDARKIANYSTLYWWVSIDPVTGASRLKLSTDQAYANVVYEQSGQAGVPVQMAQLSRDYMGTAMSVVGGIAGTAMAAGMGNIPGAIMSGVSSIGNVANTLMPQMHTQGSNGAMSELQDATIFLYGWFGLVVDDDNADRGRPLCKKGTISSYPGYLVCADPDVSISQANQTEMDTIREFMSTGFFYE